MSRVVIGMDPHKRSATIEVIDEREQVLAQGRYETDSAGYQAMLAAGRRFSDRVWAVEGCAGIGRHIAQRLVADGETVLDVPAKLSARVRVFDTGQGRKTDPVDAHSVAAPAPRSSTASTKCCSRSSPAGRKGSSHAARPATCCGPRQRQWASSPRPATSWPVNSSTN